MVEILIIIILNAIVVEAITSVFLSDDSIFHKNIWGKIQKTFAVWGVKNSFFMCLHQLSTCNYCLSFWISIIVSVLTFKIDVFLIWLTIIVWRLSLLFDVIYRYLLVRSFIGSDMDIEE